MEMFRDVEGMDMVEKWLDWLGKKGRTDQTLYIYRSAMKHCLTALSAAGLALDPERMGEPEVQYIAGEDGKERSRRLRVHVLTSYIKWATGRDVSMDLACVWNHEEADRTFIDAEDFRYLMEIADERERVILTMGAYMGLRRGEIANVKLSDISNGSLTVYGKGHGRGKRAVMRMPPAVLDAIRDYMAVRPPTSIDTLLVRSVHGTLKAMSEQILYTLVKDLGERARVEVTPHALRRLYATTLHDRSVDLDDIRTLMRHERIETTLDCYIRPDRKRLDRIVDELVI